MEHSLAFENWTSWTEKIVHGLEMVSVMAPVYTWCYSKHMASLDGGKDHPNYSHMRFITFPNIQAEYASPVAA